jgi:hypothetical protein
MLSAACAAAVAATPAVNPACTDDLRKLRRFMRISLHSPSISCPFIKKRFRVV